MDPEVERLISFMAGRSSVSSRSELLDAGFSASRIKNWKRCGRLVPLFRSVFSYGRDIETRHAAFRAALLAAGPGSALTGRSALEVWGAIKPRPSIPQTIEVATESDRAFDHRGLSQALRHTTVRVARRRFGPGDVRRKDGLEATKTTLALIDFAVDASVRDLRFAFLEACRLKRFGRRDVEECFARISGRRGARKLRPLLAAWVPELQRTRSVFEGLVILGWSERGHEMPLVNVKVFGREVDLFFPKAKLAVELDGAAFHGDEMSRKLDAEKTRFLESKGLRVERVTYTQFEADPGGEIDRLEAIRKHREGSMER
jgi:hypothetical protein